MAARITIAIDDAAIDAALARVEAAGLDARALFDDIGASMVVQTQERFLREKDPQYRFWKRHAKSTKRRRGPNAPVLRDRNLLFRSLTHEASRTYARWGTNRKYAAIHQFGGTIERQVSRRIVTTSRRKDGRVLFAKKNTKAKSRVDRLVQVGAHRIVIPARPYLGINDADRAIIAEKVEAYLKAAAEGK